MELIPMRTTHDIEEAALLFAQIDSSISFMFVMNRHKAISAYLIKESDTRILDDTEICTSTSACTGMDICVDVSVNLNNVNIYENTNIDKNTDMSINISADEDTDKKLDDNTNEKIHEKTNKSVSENANSSLETNTSLDATLSLDIISSLDTTSNADITSSSDPTSNADTTSSSDTTSNADTTSSSDITSNADTTSSPNTTSTSTPDPPPNPITTGAYFCYQSGQNTYIYIALENETPTCAALLTALCRENLHTLNQPSIEIWIKNENQLTINQLKQTFRHENTGYGMTEFAMSRFGFVPTPLPSELTIKGYEPLHFKAYLSLLDTAMTYHGTPDFYTSREDEYREDFLNGDKKGYFKTFWRGTVLIGLYLRVWKCGDDLALLAINPDFQRKGYGAALLSHAANALFTTTPKDTLYLYCMDQNTAAKSFYIKQRMRISGHSYKFIILP